MARPRRLADDSRPEPVSSLRRWGRSRAGAAPLVLFPTLTLPGWVTWRRFIDALRDERMVLTFQLLANRWGFMRREPPADYSVRLETRAIQRALREAEIPGPMDLVGHSAGGTLALDFALEHAERVRSLTLIEPAALWVLRDAGVFGRFEARVRRRIEDCSACRRASETADF